MFIWLYRDIIQNFGTLFLSRKKEVFPTQGHRLNHLLKVQGHLNKQTGYGLGNVAGELSLWSKLSNLLIKESVIQMNFIV